MTMWIPNLDGRPGPKYRAIADAIDQRGPGGHPAGRHASAAPPGPGRPSGRHGHDHHPRLRRSFAPGADFGTRRPRHVHSRDRARGRAGGGADRPEHQRPDARQGSGRPRVPSLPASRSALDAAARLRPQPGASAAPAGDGLVAGAAGPERESRASRADGGRPARPGRFDERRQQAGRHGARRGAHLQRHAHAGPADAPQAPRRVDGRRRPAPRRARRRLPHHAGAHPLLHAAAAEPDVRRDVRSAAAADCRGGGEVSAHRHRGRHLRVPLPRARAAGDAHPLADDLRHQPLEEPVSRHASRVRRRRAGDSSRRSPRRCGRR